MKNLSKTKNITAFLTLILIGVFVYLTGDTFAGFIPASGITIAGMIPFVNLDHEETNCNMAGISTIVYVARIQDIEEFPKLPSNINSPEHTVDLVGDFIMKNGKFFHTFYSTQEMGEFKSEVTGSRDSEYVEISGSFFYPNTNSKALGMMNILKNADVIIIFKEFSGSGQMRVIGQKDLPARIKGSEATGKAYSDQKGITFNVEAKSCSVPFVYNGIIATEAGEIQTPYIITVTEPSEQIILDGALNSRFIYSNLSMFDQEILDYQNFTPGSVIRLENRQTAENFSLYYLVYGGYTIELPYSSYVDLFFIEENIPVVINAGEFN